MSVFIKMTNNANDGVKVLEVAIRNAGDWSAFWGTKTDSNGVSADWAESRIDMFLSQGASTGPKWANYNALEKKYYVPVKRWALGGGPMQQGSVLRWSKTPQSRTAGRERLFPSMCVQSNADYVYNVQGNIVTLGTNLSYASNHDNGTGGWTRKFGKKKSKSVTVLTPKRPLTRFGDPFIGKLRDRLGKTAAAMGGKVGITDAQYAANFKLNGGKIGLA